MLSTRPLRYVPVGTIVYIQDGIRPFGRDRWAPIIRREPWIVEAWHNREVGAGAVVDGKYITTYAKGGHLATVRSLRTGRRTLVADWILRWCDDAGLAVAA